jgi:hypothetical protein
VRGTRAPTATATATADRDRRLRRAAVRPVVVLVAVIAFLAVAWALRLTPNEDHAAGLTATAALDARFEAWRDGRLELAEEPADLGDGVSGARIPRAVGGDDLVLVAAGGSRCYALWWDADGVRRGRTLATNLPCQPAGIVTSQRAVDIDRAGRAASDPTTPYDWSPVVPEAERLRFWFLPALVVGGGVALAQLAQLSMLAITRDPERRR